MMCMKCGKHPATVHLKQSLNGVVKEEYLCPLCADVENSFFTSAADMGAESLFDALFSGGRQSVSGSRVSCPLCGITESELRRSGKAGCAKCYEVFRPQLKAAASRIHGGARHIGRIPEAHREETERIAKINELKDRQLKAIEEQDFELAARLRDEIKALNESSEKSDKKEGN